MMLSSTSFIIFYFAVISACWGVFVAMYCYTRREAGGGCAIYRIQQKFIMKAISARIILIIFAALLCGWVFLQLKIICQMDVLLQSNNIHTSTSNVAAAADGRRRGRLRKGSNEGNKDLLQMESRLSSRLKKRVTSCRKQRLSSDQTEDLCMKYDNITKSATHLFLYNPTNRDKFMCGKNLVIGPGMIKVSCSSIVRFVTSLKHSQYSSLSQPITPTIVGNCGGGDLLRARHETVLAW